MIPTRRIFEICIFIAVMIIAGTAFHAWLASHDDQLRLQATLATQKQQLDAANDRERDRAATLNQTLAQIEKLKRETQTPQQILRDLPQYLKLPQPITLDSPTNVISAGTPGEVVPDAAGRSASAPNPIRREIMPAATSTPIQAVRSFPPTSAATAATEAQLGAADKSASAASGNVPADAKSTSTPAQATRPSSAPSSAEIPAVDLKPLYDYVQDCRACQAQLIAAKQNHADDATKLQAMTRERDAAIITANGGTFWRRFRRNAEWFVIGAATGAAVIAAHGLDHHR